MLLQIAAYTACGLLVVVGVLALLLKRARKREAQAEAAMNSLLAAEELRNEGDKIMAEPVADELAWLAERKRVRELNRST